MAMTLTVEEFERVKDCDFADDVELQQALDGCEHEYDEETVAALGGGYVLGNVEIPPVTVGVFPLLEMIGSPFLREDANDVGLRDIMLALYVMCDGRDAVAPISTIARRRAALERQKPMAEKSPEMFAQYLAACDRIEQDWMVFEIAAQDFIDSIGQFDIQDAADVIISALNDAMAGFAALPKNDDGKSSKKKRGTTRNG